MIHPHADTPWAPLFGINNRTGDLGIELEIEGENLPGGEIESWVVKPEGSLRGKGGRQVPPGERDSPYEYVLGRPSMFKTLEKKLQKLQDALTAEGVTVRITERGSTHIHINMTDYSIREIIGFCAIFTCIEPVLLRYCGPTRNGNLFCLPSYETGEWVDSVNNMVQGVIHGRFRDYWPARRGKYASLNTDTLVTFGSLEVRCFPNCIDAKTITGWGKWLMNIRTLAREWDDDTYQSLIDKAYDNPSWLLKEVFEGESMYGHCYPNTPEELVRFGIEHGYEIIKAAHPMLDWSGKAPEKTVKSKKSWTDRWDDAVRREPEPEPEPVFWGPMDEEHV